MCVCERYVGEEIHMHLHLLKVFTGSELGI